MKTPEQLATYAFSGADSASLTVAIAKRITVEAIEADRAQQREQALLILATDDAIPVAIDEMGIDWNAYRPSREQVELALANMGLLVYDSIRAHEQMSRNHHRIRMGEPVIFVSDDGTDVIRIDVMPRTRMKRGLLVTDGVVLKTRSAELVRYTPQQWVHLDDSETVEERREEA